DAPIRLEQRLHRGPAFGKSGAGMPDLPSARPPAPGGPCDSARQLPSQKRDLRVTWRTMVHVPLPEAAIMIPRKRGFTLIELLVVIALIAILVGILFPVFAQVRSEARKTTCLSNTKQVALAALMYAGDYDEVFPRVDNNGQCDFGEVPCSRPDL